MHITEAEANDFLTKQINQELKDVIDRMFWDYGFFGEIDDKVIEESGMTSDEFHLFCRKYWKLPMENHYSKFLKDLK